MTAEFAYSLGMIVFVVGLLLAGFSVYKLTRRP